MPLEMSPHAETTHPSTNLLQASAGTPRWADVYIQCSSLSSLTWSSPVADALKSYPACPSLHKGERFLTVFFLLNHPGTAPHASVSQKRRPSQRYMLPSQEVETKGADEITERLRGERD